MATVPPGQGCGTCMFQVEGYCRRAAPQAWWSPQHLYEHISTGALWPPVQEADWCGEYVSDPGHGKGKGHRGEAKHYPERSIIRSEVE